MNFQLTSHHDHDETQAHLHGNRILLGTAIGTLYGRPQYFHHYEKLYGIAKEDAQSGDHLNDLRHAAQRHMDMDVI